MKKLFSLLFFVVSFAGHTHAEDITVSFDFTDKAEINALGISTPDNGSGTNVESALIKDGVTITNDNKEASTHTRIWATNSGVLDLRVYNGAELTITVAGGKYIKEMTWTTANSVNFSSDSGTATGTGWLGENSKVVLSCTANTRINVLTVVYGDKSEPYTGKTQTFDFTSSEQFNSWGVAVAEPGSGTSVNGMTLTVGDASMSFNDGEATTTCREFTATNGSINIRTYSGSAVTFSVSDGYVIEKIEITSGNTSNMISEKNSWSAGSLSDNCIWKSTEGTNVNSVVLTAGATLQFNKVTIYYQSGTPSAIRHTVTEDKTETYYNLRGQRINAGQAKGIVIVGDKKVLKQ